jgi:hypothetical protein
MVIVGLRPTDAAFAYVRIFFEPPVCSALIYLGLVDCACNRRGEKAEQIPRAGNLTG